MFQIKNWLKDHSAQLVVLGIGLAISIAIAGVGGDVTAGVHRGR
jgi:hypothetical protein